VKQSATTQLVNKSAEGFFVFLRCGSFEVTDSSGVHMEAKEPVQLAGNMHLRQSQLDVEIERIGLDARTELTFSPACFFRLANCSAALTLIPMEAVG
jgi:hypothetical protein